MKRQNKISNRSKRSAKGFSVIEAIVGVTILAFVLMTIISALIHQRTSTKKTSSKNIAITLADMKLQEMMQYSAEQLEIFVQEPTHLNRVVEYITYSNGQYVVADELQNDQNSFRRSTWVELDLLGELATIQVVVDYGPLRRDSKGTLSDWPFKVGLSTKRAGDFK